MLCFGFAFLYIPIVLVIIYSFNDSKLVTVWGGWSIRWYVELFNNENILNAALLSFRIEQSRQHLQQSLEQWRV